MVAAQTTRLVRASDGCVHFSELKFFALSPLHDRHAVTRPRVATRAMRIGTIVDRLVFGGDVPVYPGDERRGTTWELFVLLAGGGTPITYEGERRGKAWKDFQAANPGARIFTRREVDGAAALVAQLAGGRTYHADDFVTWKELAEAEPIAEALKRDPLAQEYLAGRHQVPLAWDAMGVRCATGGVDVVGDGWISDLKVTQTTQPDRLAFHAQSRMLWHAQLAWYDEGCRANGIDTSKGLFLVGVEATAPHPVTVLRLSERALEQGRKACHLWLEQLRVCEASDRWPGYVQSVVELAVDVEIDRPGLEPDDEVAS